MTFNNIKDKTIDPGGILNYPPKLLPPQSSHTSRTYTTRSLNSGTSPPLEDSQNHPNPET